MNNVILIRKMGGFYVCFDNDAIILSYLCDYKLNNSKVGFPIGTINKVTNILDNNSVSYIVKENNNEVAKNIFGKKNKYKQILEKGNNKVNLDHKINSIVEKINNMEEEDIEKLLNIIENNI